MTTTSDQTSSDILPAEVKDLLPYFLLIFAVVCFYANIYDNGLLYDDDYLILKNQYLRSWHALGAIFSTYVNSGAFRYGQFYRPLQNVLYLIVYQIGGVTLFGFHLLNLSLHAANTCLVYRLGRKLGFHAGAVFFAALIWALHPIQTEAVTYMSATADTLYAFFCLSGLVVVLPDFTPRKILAAVPLFILGLLSKETAIVFPLLVMVCFYLTQQRRLDPRAYIRTWPLWCVVGIYLAARLVFVPFHGAELLSPDPISQLYGKHFEYRVATFLSTLPNYLKLFLWPVGLHMDRDFPVALSFNDWDVLAGAAMLFAAIGQIFWGRGRRGLALSWGLLWFGAAHVPQSGLLMPVNSLFLEHWMYLPSVGLFLGIAQKVANQLHNPKIRTAAAALATIIALVLGVLTFRQNAVWHDPIVFYNNIFDHGETSVRARNNLGVAYMTQGDYGKAMEQFQLALKNNDMTPETHQDIAALLAMNPDGKPHVQEELTELKRALAIKPDFLPACDALAELYDYLGDKTNADLYRQQAATIRRKFHP